MSDQPKTLDGVGVLLTRDGDGRLVPHRIGIVDGRIVEIEALSTGRAQWAALHAVRDDLDSISQGISRGTIELSQPLKARLAVHSD